MLVMDGEKNKEAHESKVDTLKKWSTAKAEVHAVPLFTGRLRVVAEHDSREVQTPDERLDERKEWEAFWASFEEFDR